MTLFDKTSQKIENSGSNQAITTSTETNTPKLVPINDDLSLKVDSRKIFFSILEDFRSAPVVELQDKAIETLRSSPTMFNEKLDKDLEASIFRFKGLLVQRNKVAQNFILELMKSMKGENLEMMKKFLSFSIDADFVDFVSFYSKTPDLNCMLITYLGDNLPDEEKYNELAERLKVIDAYIASDKTEYKEYAQRCQLVLKLTVDRLGAVTAPPADQSEAPASQVDPLTTPASGTAP